MHLKVNPKESNFKEVVFKGKKIFFLSGRESPNAKESNALGHPREAAGGRLTTISPTAGGPGSRSSAPVQTGRTPQISHFSLEVPSQSLNQEEPWKELNLKVSGRSELGLDHEPLGGRGVCG